MASIRGILPSLCVGLICSKFNHTLATEKPLAELKRETLEFTLPENKLDVQIPPGNLTGGPTFVEVFAHILSIDKIDEEKREFTLTFFLRQTWKDFRLRYDDNKEQIRYLIIDDGSRIWTPNTYFSNAKKSHSYELMRPNVYLKLFPDGSVLYNRRITVTVSCNMDYKWFPFDVQKCELRLGVFGSTIDDVVLSWRDYVSVTLSTSIDLPMFELMKFNTYSKTIPSNSGAFNVLTLTFYLSRRLGYYLYHIYVPFTMLIFLSWFQFWMNRKDFATRLMIGLSSLITTIIMIQFESQKQAKISYRTCLDCFTGFCLMILFGSFAESVIVYILAEINERNKNAVETTEGNAAQKDANGRIMLIKMWLAKIPHKVEFFDVVARILVPLLYGIFCLIYFCVAMCGNHEWVEESH